MSVDFFSLKKIHIIGIGGIGVSAIARFFLAQGASVTGSDVTKFDDFDELVELGAEITVGHAEENVPADVQVVIRSPAVPDENPEVRIAVKRSISCLSYPEALGLLMERYHGVVVSGTNGKTTTVALLGKILEKEGWDPLVVVGGKIPGWQKNIRIPITSGAGEGRDFPYNIMVAEGCEYRRHMQKLRPTVIVLTNLEEDHLDYFRDISDVKDAFKEYIAALPEENGILIYNADDENVRTVADSLEKSKIRKISYSLESEADAQASGIMYALDGQVFRVQWEGINLGVFSLQLPGRFNVYNAVAAGTAALSLGVQPNSIRVAFEEFSGSWRRFEKVGMIDEKIIISDYAHHPTAVKGTIKAANEFYPGKKILAVFEPHQRNRTEHFLEDFAGSFNGVDTVVVSEIYDVAGRDASTSGVSSRDLVEAIKKKNGSPPVGYAGSLEEAEKRIRELMDPFDIILIMGAGDIYKIAEKLAGTRAKL